MLSASLEVAQRPHQAPLLLAPVGGLDADEQGQQCTAGSHRNAAAWPQAGPACESAPLPRNASAPAQAPHLLKGALARDRVDQLGLVGRIWGAGARSGLIWRARNGGGSPRCPHSYSARTHITVHTLHVMRQWHDELHRRGCLGGWVLSQQADVKCELRHRARVLVVVVAVVCECVCVVEVVVVVCVCVGGGGVELGYPGQGFGAGGKTGWQGSDVPTSLLHLLDRAGLDAGSSRRGSDNPAPAPCPNPIAAPCPAARRPQ